MFKKKFLSKSKLILLMFIIFIKPIFAEDTYFDLSENNIKINTDFNGKEIIIFGILEDDKETILTIKGPIKDSKFQIRLASIYFQDRGI